MSSGQIKAYKIIRSDIDDLNRVQDRIADAFSAISSSDVINGVLLKSLSLSTGVENLIAHKLGRKPKGYIVIRKRSQSDIWDEQDSVEMPNKYLDLRCSANVLIDLWIF
jgi:hypothetical protein